MSKYANFLFNRKAATHNGEIQQLYEEMEQQIKNEKDLLRSKVKNNFSSFILFVTINGEATLFICKIYTLYYSFARSVILLLRCVLM